MSPKFFFTHDLQMEYGINIRKIQSSNNLVDLFTKSLPTSKFEKMVRNTGMRRFKDIKCCIHQGELETYCTLFLSYVFSTGGDNSNEFTDSDDCDFNHFIVDEDNMLEEPEIDMKEFYLYIDKTMEWMVTMEGQVQLCNKENVDAVKAYVEKGDALLEVGTIGSLLI
ncbi:hypothetical protein LXL04_017038 [Taraxacum kok-saghyz]